MYQFLHRIPSPSKITTSRIGFNNRNHFPSKSDQSSFKRLNNQMSVMLLCDVDVALQESSRPEKCFFDCFQVICWFWGQCSASLVGGGNWSTGVNNSFELVELPHHRLTRANQSVRCVGVGTWPVAILGTKSNGLFGICNIRSNCLSTVFFWK